jgi:DNA-binding transcriptional ArsR family regulator
MVIVSLLNTRLLFARSLATVPGSVPIGAGHRFVYDESMVAEPPAEIGAAGIAAAIGEPARARMLYCLMDRHARTSTELAVVGEVSPSTASVHLARLKQQRLVTVLCLGKHRYYSLGGASIARALEALTVAAGGTSSPFVPHSNRLKGPRAPAMTIWRATSRYYCATASRNWNGWRRASAMTGTQEGGKALATLGIDVDALCSLRRRQGSKAHTSLRCITK